jgi:ABC-type glycerol-3-phosphate transport system substrate-binding protein
MKVTRRQLLRLAVLAGAGTLAAACGQPQSAQPAAPKGEAKPTEVAKPAAPAAQPAATQPAAGAAQQAPAAAQGNAALRAELTHWGWAGSLDALKNATPLFNEAYPNIKMNYVEMSGNDVRDKLLVSLASGTGAPDSSGLQDRFIPLLIDKGGLVDLTDRVSAYRDKFAQYKWAAYTDDRDRIYGLPWDASPMATYYRADLWQAAGLESDPDKLDEQIQTYDDFIELGKKLTGDQKLIALSTNQSINRSNSDDLVEGTLIQHQAHMFDEDGKVRDPNPRAVQVLTLLKKLVDSGVALDVGRDDLAPWTAALKEGKVTAEPNAVWAMAFIRPAAPETEGKWRVFRLPAVERGGKRSSLNGGSATFVTEQSKNKEAALAFIEFMMTNPQALVVGWQKNSVFPAYLPAFDDPAFDQPDPVYGGQKAARVFADALPEIPPMTYTTHYLDAHGAALDAVTAVLKGVKSPEEAWAEAIARTKRAV